MYNVSWYVFGLLHYLLYMYMPWNMKSSPRKSPWSTLVTDWWEGTSSLSGVVSAFFLFLASWNPFAQTTKTKFQHEHFPFSLLLNPSHWLRVSFFWGWVDPPTRLTSKDGWWALPARDTLIVYWNCTHMCKYMYIYILIYSMHIIYSIHMIVYTYM